MVLPIHQAAMINKSRKKKYLTLQGFYTFLILFPEILKEKKIHLNTFTEEFKVHLANYNLPLLQVALSLPQVALPAEETVAQILILRDLFLELNYVQRTEDFLNILKLESKFSQ